MKKLKLYIKTTAQVILLIFCFTLSLNAKKNQDVIIPFQLVHGMIILDLEVDGEKGAFLLDTGADAILIDGIPCESSNASMSTLAGEVRVGATELKNVKIGTIVQRDVVAQVVSMSLLEKNLGIDLFGIIGGAYFMPRSLYMDFTTSTITISDKSFGKKAVKGMSAVKFEMVHDIPIVKVEIGDQIYDFALDSGASTHFLHSGVLETVVGLTQKKASASVLSANHLSTKLSRYNLATLKMGDNLFHNQDCLVQNFDEVNKELGREVGGILSLSTLAKGKVIIDFRKKKMYF